MWQAAAQLLSWEPPRAAPIACKGAADPAERPHVRQLHPIGGQRARHTHVAVADEAFALEVTPYLLVPARLE